jgi:apolipoprotein N-acyltransferase
MPAPYAIAALTGRSRIDPGRVGADMRWRMKFLLLSFLLGLLSATGFAPLSLWPLTLLAFAGLMWLVESAPRLRSALARGWWFGVGQFVLGLNWIATAFTYQAAMPHWLGWIAVVLLSLYLAVYPAMAAGLAWRYGAGHRLVMVLVLAAAWTVTEWLRATMFTGFAWNPVGVALLPTGASRLSALIGTYGLSGIAVLLAGALFLLVQGRWRSAAAIAVPVAAASALLVPLQRAPEAGGPPVRIVQPNIGQQTKWDPEFEQENFRRLAGLTGAPLDEPRLVLWPEAATPDYIEIDHRARRSIAGLIGPEDAMLLGAVALDFGPDGYVSGAWNSAYAIDAGGRILGRYDKAHLVPYGEYLPMRPLLSAIGLSRLSPGDLDYGEGPGPRTLDVGRFGRAGLQICYEIIFSGDVVDPRDRPDFIFNPSNDAWFGAWGPPQHLAQARLRALEEGIPVLRSTPTGISAVIDSEGRLLASLPWRTAGAIDARLPAARAPTPFARAGNILPFLFALALGASAFAVRRKAG